MKDRFLSMAGVEITKRTGLFWSYGTTGPYKKEFITECLMDGTMEGKS